MKNRLRIKFGLIFGLIIMMLAFANEAKAGASTWTGTTSSDWSVGSNWGGTVPDNTKDITIPTSPTGGRFPIISNGTTAVGKSIAIQAGASITQEGGTLTIGASGQVSNKSWVNNGTFSATGGTVNFAYGTAGNETFAGGTNQFYNVIVGASYTGFSRVANSALSVRGNWTDQGTAALTITNAYTVTFNGSGPQTITTSRGTNNSFSILVINNPGGTVSLANAIKTAGNISVESSAFLNCGGVHCFRCGHV